MRPRTLPSSILANLANLANNLQYIHVTYCLQLQYCRTTFGFSVLQLLLTRDPRRIGALRSVAVAVAAPRRTSEVAVADVAGRTRSTSLPPKCRDLALILTIGSYSNLLHLIVYAAFPLNYSFAFSLLFLYNIK